MATNEAAVSPAEVPASKQPPENSVWIRYHPWIEGVMAHIGAWSIHLLVIGGAILWFMYLAYALGFAHAPRSLPMEAVRLDIGGGGGNKEGTGTEKGGDHAPLTEGVQADKDNPGEKNNKVDPSDRQKLTDIQANKIERTFDQPDTRFIQQNAGSMQAFADLNKDLHDKIHDGINPSKGNGGTGTAGGTGTGIGTGTGPGTGAGKKVKLSERQQRSERWGISFGTIASDEYLRDLEAIGAVLAIPVGPGSYEVIDLTKRPFKAEISDLSGNKKIWWYDTSPASVPGLIAALGLPLRANAIVVLIPNELEDEFGKLEWDYQHLPEKKILRTKFAITVPGMDGRKYDVKVIEQPQK